MKVDALCLRRSGGDEVVTILRTLKLMKALVLSALVLIGCNVTLCAKIGETEAQTEKALGKPFDIAAPDLKSYMFGAFNVSVFYMDGVSESETFVKRDHSAISQHEIMQLIRLNSGGVIWDRGKVNGQVLNWHSSDGKKTRLAAYAIPLKTFVISSGKYFASHHLEPKPTPAAAAPEAGGDDRQLAHYFETGAAAGNPNAQVNLGWMYHEGKGVPRDYKKAVELYEKAAEQGYAPGQAYLASQYATGKGVDKDYKKALELFQKAIAQNVPHAFNEFAWFLATCPDDAQRDGKKAVEYARKACDLTGWRNKNFVDTLAAAYAESGDFDRAITYQQQALIVPGDYPDQQVMMNALQLYRDRKPYRESEPQ